MNNQSIARIPLGKTELFTIIDKDQYAFVSQWKWHLRSGYPVRAVYKGDGTRSKKHISLHRVLAEAGEGQIVDHANGDPLDNRKMNLRICTHLENARNRAITGGTSRYKGVSFDKSMYFAMIRVNGVLKSLGMFVSEVEAAQCYNAAAKKYFKEFARLNDVPESGLTWQEMSSNSRFYRNIKKLSSGYTGVSYNKRLRKWVANLCDEGRGSYLGLFKTEELAATCVDAAIFEKHGNEYPRNFPKRDVVSTLKQILSENNNKLNTYIGVRRQGRRWYARLVTKGKEVHIGIYDSEIEAAIGRDKYIVDNNIKRVKLNLPVGCESEK